MLRLVNAQLHRQPRPLRYSIYLLPALGKHVFLEYSRQLKLEGRPDYAAYAELLPASFTPGSNEAASASAAASGSVAVQSNGSDSSSPHVSDAITANHVKPRDYDAVLTKLANSGLYKLPVQQLCQEHWPTPNSADWQQTQDIVRQLSIVLEWMYSKVQHPKKAQQDYKELKGTITQLLHHLLLGHLVDMALDMREVFGTSFKVVIRIWMESQADQGSASAAHPSSMAEGRLAAQLGRAFLRRFTADKAVAEHLFDDASGYDHVQEGKCAGAVRTFFMINCLLRELQALGLHCGYNVVMCAVHRLLQCDNQYVLVNRMMTGLLNTG